MFGFVAAALKMLDSWLFELFGGYPPNHPIHKQARKQGE